MQQDASMSALLAATRFHQQLQAGCAIARRRHQWLQGGLILSSSLAVALAIWPCIVTLPLPNSVFQLNSIALVLVGLAFTVLTVWGNQRDNQSWQMLAGGVARLERAIYLYRSVLQMSPERDQWLNQQLAQVQQQVQAQWGNLPVSPLLAQSKGSIPDSSDLLIQDYLQQRLEPKLRETTQSLARAKATQKRYQLATIVCGGLIVLLPLVGRPVVALSAIAVPLGLGSLLWLQMIDLNRWIEIQNQLQQGLTLLQNHWLTLPRSAWKGESFVKLVTLTEELLGLPYPQSKEPLQELTHALHKTEPELLAQIVSQLPPALEQALRVVEVAVPPVSHTSPEVTVSATVVTETAAVSAKSAEANGHTPEPTAKAVTVTATVAPAAPPPPATPNRGRPHVFVVMPFGRKQGGDGRWYNFNAIYQTLIKPAIEAAGFESFRADEEEASGDIITDMFQELLLADMVIADLSIDNANAFYELGIRHALRRRGVVHIQAGRAYMPFDIFNVRTLPYHCDDTGCPDPDFIEKDKQAITKMLVATWGTDRNQSQSPIFNVLTGLEEPDRKSLQTPLARGYWQEYTNLQVRISTAQRQKRLGDVVLLAEEVSNPLIKEDIIAEAGMALRNMGNSALALKEYRQGLKLNPENISFRCEEAFHLSRLGQTDEAIVKLEQVLRDVPDCVDAASKLARIFKDLWKQAWMGIEDEDERLQKAYESSFLLQKAIANYLRGFQLNQNEYYPGVNALSMTALLDHLAAIAPQNSDDEEEALYRRKLPALKGAVQFCLESTLQKTPNDPWVTLSMGELSVCVAEKPHQVATAYRKALALLWNSKFTLQAALDQLKLMQLIQFRPEHVQAGISVLQAELDRLSGEKQVDDEEDKGQYPDQVFLFSGHMIDSPGRLKPRFPADMELEVTQRIEAVLDKLGANAKAIAMVPGLACGGDIIFVEACLKRGMQVEAYLPFEPSEFIQASVDFAGDKWVERFYNIVNHPNVKLHFQLDRLGPVLKGDNAYERNNRWALYSTLVYSIKAVRLIVLWDGQGGNGPGGTADMVQQVRQLGGIVEHLDTTKFDYWQAQPAVKELAIAV